MQVFNSDVNQKVLGPYFVILNNIHILNYCRKTFLIQEEPRYTHTHTHTRARARAHTYKVFLKMGLSHIGDGEWIKGNKKFLYYFENECGPSYEFTQRGLTAYWLRRFLF